MARRVAVGIVTACILEAAVLVAFAAQLPPPLRLDPEAADAAGALDAIDRELAATLPPLADRLAWLPVHRVGSYGQLVRERDPLLDETHAGRVSRLNDALVDLGARYRTSVALLTAALLLTAWAASWVALRGPSWLTGLVPLLSCVLVSPLAADAVLEGARTAGLYPLVAPCVLGGLALLGLRATRAAGAERARREGRARDLVSAALDRAEQPTPPLAEPSRPADGALRWVALALAAACLLEGVALLALALSIGPAPRLSHDAADPAPVISAIQQGHVDRLPPFARTFAWQGYMGLRHSTRRVLRPEPLGAWDTATYAERVARFNEDVAALGDGYRGAASLLVAALFAGAAAGLWVALRGATLLAACVPLASCLCVSNPVTGALLRAEYDFALVPFLLPLIVLGPPFLALTVREARADRARLAGALAARPEWVALAAGLALGALGAGGIALGVAERVNALASVGAVFVANALVLVGAAAFWALQRARGRG